LTLFLQTIFLSLLSSLADRVHRRPIGESRVRESRHSSQDLYTLGGRGRTNTRPSRRTTSGRSCGTWCLPSPRR
ncbi:unnamed protein product, partial [Phaeothamnion confervicola]